LNVKEVRIRNVRSGSGERMSLLQLWRQHGGGLTREEQIAVVQVGFGAYPAKYRVQEGQRVVILLDLNLSAGFLEL
jgi:hypothetical protein